MANFPDLPQDASAFCAWPWEQVEACLNELLARELTEASIAGWLEDWSRLTALLYECAARLSNASAMNTADLEARKQFERFFQQVLQPAAGMVEQVRARWLASGLVGPGYERLLEQLLQQKSLFCPANLPLEAHVEELLGSFFYITSAQTVTWQGQELCSGAGIHPALQQASRADAEKLWRLDAARQSADLPALSAIWSELFDLRCRMAENAGYASYLKLRWAQMQRDHFTPADCLTFHEAIAQVVVPAASRIYARHRAGLGLDSLRPWDLPRTPPGQPALRPFANAAELQDGCARIFQRIDPDFGSWFYQLRADGLLDLEARPNKVSGGFSRHYAVTRQSFISLNVTGAGRDVFDLIHEVGHSLSVMETRHLSFLQMVGTKSEGGGDWTEFTSQAAEMLALPYIGRDAGGFYAPADTRRAESEQLEQLLLFLPFMASVDAFQLWAYTHPEEGRDSQQCSQQWLALQERFEPGVDWSGLEPERSSTWLSHALIFSQPLFFVEYGISMLGALQVWRAARQDPASAAARYRQALALAGKGRSIPELYAAAGVRYGFDAGLLGELVAEVEERIAQLAG